jgi:chromosome segregation ATPase
MAKNSSNPIRIPSARAGDQPATRKMLTLVRNELRSDIRSLERKMEARFASLDSRFTSIDSRFSSIDSRFSEIDSRFAQQDSRFDALDSRLSRMELLLEEQNSNNRIVLEGLQALWQRQDRIERRSSR